MKGTLRSKVMAFGLLLGASASIAACTKEASAPPPPPPKAAVTDIEVATATVTAINHRTRRVTLRGDSGNVVTLTAGPEVQNLAQVKRGDRVTVRYRVSLAAEVKKPGEPGAPLSVRQETFRTPGERPSAARGREIKGTVTIVSVDSPNSRVTFTNPSGETRTVLVMTETGRQFVSQLKPGDQVEMTYTEAVAVAVEPGN